MGVYPRRYTEVFYHCYNCHKVSPSANTGKAKCPLCDSANGELLTRERFDEGVQAGVFYNIDAKSRKPKKKRS